MLQHIAIQRVHLGIVDVRRQHALAQIIQHHYASHTTQSAKRNAFSCNSAQTRRLERKTSSRTETLLQLGQQPTHLQRRFVFGQAQ